MKLVTLIEQYDDLSERSCNLSNSINILHNANKDSNFDEAIQLLERKWVEIDKQIRDIEQMEVKEAV